MDTEHKKHHNPSGGKKYQKREVAKWKEQVEQGVATRTDLHNARSYMFSSGVKSVGKLLIRNATREALRAKAPRIDKTPEIAAPLNVVVYGMPQSGKTTLIKNLVKHYSKHNLESLRGPVTCVTNMNRRITFFEADPTNVTCCIDLSKIADIVIFIAHAKLGWQTDTFEFLTMLHISGMPRVLGVITFLDLCTTKQDEKKCRERLTRRLREEVSSLRSLQEMKGLEAPGKYRFCDIQRLAHRINSLKFVPPRWRLDHPYLLAHAWHIQKTSSELCTLKIYGYVQGTFMRPGSEAHIPGLGDIHLTSIEPAQDPCPSAEKVEQQRKKELLGITTSLSKKFQTGCDFNVRSLRTLKQRHVAIYAPGCDTYGAIYDNSAYQINTYSRDETDKTNPLNILQTCTGGLSQIVDPTISILPGTKPVKLQPEIEPIVEESDHENLQFSNHMTLEQFIYLSNRPISDLADGLIEKYTTQLNVSNIPTGVFADESLQYQNIPISLINKLQYSKRFINRKDSSLDCNINNFNFTDSPIFSPKIQKHSLQVINNRNLKEIKSTPSCDYSSCSSSDETNIDFESVTNNKIINKNHNKISLNNLETNKSDEIISDNSDSSDNSDDSYMLSTRNSKSKYLANITEKSIRSLENDGDISQSKKSLLTICESDIDSSYDSDSSIDSSKVRGKNTTGEQIKSDKTRKVVTLDSDSDNIDLESDLESDLEAISADLMNYCQSRYIPDCCRLLALPHEFQNGTPLDVVQSESGSAKVVESLNTLTSVWTEERIQKLKYNKFLTGITDRIQKAAEQNEENTIEIKDKEEIFVNDTAHKIGQYVCCTLENINSSFCQNLSWDRPLIIGILAPGESEVGYARARVVQQRWVNKIQKSRNPMIISNGWRRFQTAPVFCMEDESGRRRFLKYTPESMHCQAVFRSPRLTPNSGILYFTTVNRVEQFRIALTGTVLSHEPDNRVQKKLKLVGYPLEIRGHRAIINKMFSSSLEVMRFNLAKVQTQSGIRGQIKGPSGDKGDCWVQFEDSIFKADIVFTKTWVPYEIPDLINPITDTNWRAERTVRELKEAQNLPVDFGTPWEKYQKPFETEIKVGKYLPKDLQKHLPARLRPIEIEHEKSIQQGARKLTAYPGEEAKKIDSSLILDPKRSKVGVPTVKAEAEYIGSVGSLRDQNLKTVLEALGRQRERRMKLREQSRAAYESKKAAEVEKVEQKKAEANLGKRKRRYAKEDRTNKRQAKGALLRKTD